MPGATVEDAVAEGYALNLPLRVGAAASATPVVTSDNPAVTVEAVKLADDGSGDVVVRLYESLGGRAQAVLRPGFPLGKVQVTDLLERPLAGQPAEVSAAREGEVAVTLRPFQILTVRLTPAG